MLVRVSIGSLAVLGLADVRLDAIPKTLYMLEYSATGCLGCCVFCAQSRASRADKRFLSRVIWPAVDLDKVISALSKCSSCFARVCVQTVLKPGFFREALSIVSRIVRACSLPVSLATTPVSRRLLLEARKVGVDILGVGLDAASPRVFAEVGKPYTFDLYMRFIGWGIAVFGRDKVYVHLIAGLGESLDELLAVMEKAYSMGARVALFNYTYTPGLPRHLPGIDVASYRALQIARLLLEEGYDPRRYIDFSKRPPQVKEQLPIDPRPALLTSGCPGCNRPFYNEGPLGPIYNYPSEELLLKDRSWIDQLRSIGVNIAWERR